MASADLLPRLAALAALTGLCCACSPVFNWRDTPIDAQLTVLLPCKPDRAQRQLPLAPDGGQAGIGMAGCAAGGATFAVAHWPGLAPGQAAERLQAWQAATRTQWGGAQVQEAPAAMAQASPVLPAQQWRLQGAQGQAQMRWFAHADGRGQVTLYQATVLGTPSAPEAAPTFFDGLRLK